MNASVYSADRATYLRIVIVALLASIAIVGFAVSARISDSRISDGRSAQAEWPLRLEGRAAEPQCRSHGATRGDPPDLSGRRREFAASPAGVDADQHVRGIAV